MDITITNKGTSGYSLNGIPGLIGSSGNSTYYSSIENVDDIKSAIVNNKTLSNNPVVYENEQKYSMNDFIITPTGDFYVISDPFSPIITLLGNIMLSAKPDVDTSYTPPSTIYLIKPKLSNYSYGLSGTILNKYNNVSNGVEEKSCLYRHITDSNRERFTGLLLFFDEDRDIYNNNINSDDDEFVCTDQFLVETIRGLNYKDPKLVFLFKSGYSFEVFIDNEDNRYQTFRPSSSCVCIDNRYIYYQGVDPSTYDSSKGQYSDHNTPFEDSDAIMKNLINLAFTDGNEPDTYLEYFYKGKQYRVKVTYV